MHRPAKIPAVNIFEDLNGVISKEQQLKRFNRETHMCEWLVELIRKFPTFCFCFYAQNIFGLSGSLFEIHKHTHMCLLLLTCMISTSKPLKILCFFIIKAFNLCSFRILSILLFPWYLKGMLCICLRKETKTKTNQSEALWTVIWGSNCC